MFRLQVRCAESERAIKAGAIQDTAANIGKVYVDKKDIEKMM